MKYDASFAELLKKGPQIAEINLDRSVSALAAIGHASASETFSQIIHTLASIPFVTPTYSTSASLRITPGCKRLNIEMEITSEMLTQIAEIEGVDSITPPLMAIPC